MRLCATLGCETGVAHRGSQARFCSDRCRVRASKGQSSEQRSCVYCARSITHLTLQSRYCDSRCKDAQRRRAPGHKAKAAERSAAWRAANPERAKEKIARWREANPDRVKEVSRRWQRDNPEAVRRSTRRRRDLYEAACSFRFTDRDWHRLLARHRHACAYCGAHGDLQREHVLPLSRGGYNGPGNFLPACSTCNKSKKDRLLSEWRYRTRRQLTL